ncbi:MAG: 30S ribosomal protein S3 [Nanoarchaeota archaeon]
MIERKFVAQNYKEFRIKEFVKESLNRVGLSEVKLKRTSTGERIIVSASRPGLVVGRGGSKIQGLTRDLKKKFDLENPQIEIEEIKEFNANAAVVAESIVNQLERFGSKRFKGIGHKAVDAVMQSGALGVEILISGKIPSSRSKTWRFVEGYMKKCGDLAISGVDTAIEKAVLKTGTVGIQVRIIPGDTKLPDQVSFGEAVTEKELGQTEESAKESSPEASEQDAGGIDDKKEISSEVKSGTSEESSSTASKKKTKKVASKKSSKKKSSSKKSTKKAASKKKDAEQQDVGAPAEKEGDHK